VDVPPKLSARTRVFTAGQGRKTDATDAHAVALAATPSNGLHPVTGDAQLEVLRVLADRRRAFGEDHTRMICQLHQLLADLIPGGAKKALSAARARALLARIRPRDAAGQARRRVAAELIADLERIYQRKKAADKEVAAAVKATGTTLMSLDGIGPSGAARLLVEVGDIAYLATRRRQGASRSVVDAPTGPSSECAPYRRLRSATSTVSAVHVSARRLSGSAYARSLDRPPPHDHRHISQMSERCQPRRSPLFAARVSCTSEANSSAG
jgi:hypothetical protein